MKFCAKCGAQISDEIKVCPQCQTPTNNQYPLNVEQYRPKKKFKKLYIIAPITVIVTAMITFMVAYFILPSDSYSGDSSVSNTDRVFKAESTAGVCPADEYGNHDWAPAKCTEPAQCYNCNAYRDDKLGQHSFFTDVDGFCDCTYCGILYEVYIDSIE